MSRTETRPWRMFVPLALVLLLAAAWSAYWFIAMGYIKEAVAQAEMRAREDGIALDCADRHFGGFPFRFSFECDKPALAVNKPDQSLAATSGNLKVFVQAWNPRHAIALLQGPTFVSSQSGGRRQEISHGIARASLRVSSGNAGEFVLDVPDIDVKDHGRAAKLIASARSEDGRKVEGAVAIDGLTALLPRDGQPMLLDRVDLMGEAPMSLLMAADPARRSAESGETITITRLSATIGALTVSSHGTLGIDAEGYPAGVVDANASDIDRLFGELVKLGVLKEKDAANARTMALLLNGGKAEDAAMKFVAKGGGLYWGLVKLAELKPVF